ncbi:MAG: chain length determinant protein (polysaccharide antigen chain regulator) [Psychromonas sp.]|jgi:chain length determinant protein (polysaccharide antigen chain regulator)
MMILIYVGLLNLFGASKWLTVVMYAVAIAGSVYYVLTAQEWWVAKGKVIVPQLNDVAALYAQSNKLSTILNSNELSNINGQDTKQVPNNILDLNTLFRNFINAFN